MTAVADVKDAGAKTKLHWDAPKAWKEMPAGQMRVAQFRVHDEPPVDVTVIPLGPESGALLPNVNRWEKELGLAPSPQEKLGALTKQTKVGDLDVTMVDLKGAEKRTLAAIVPHAGKVWFFKMQGPNDVVARQQENFNAFIDTLHAAEEGHKHGDDAEAPTPTPVTITPPTRTAASRSASWPSTPRPTAGARSPTPSRRACSGSRSAAASRRPR